MKKKNVDVFNDSFDDEDGDDDKNTGEGLPEEPLEDIEAEEEE